LYFNEHTRKCDVQSANVSTLMLRV